jgi:hypothetical protein
MEKRKRMGMKKFVKESLNEGSKTEINATLMEIKEKAESALYVAEEMRKNGDSMNMHAAHKILYSKLTSIIKNAERVIKPI